jgi:hypothetical protein
MGREILSRLKFDNKTIDLVKTAGYTNAVTTKNPTGRGFENTFALPRIAVTESTGPKTLISKITKLLE